MSKQNSASYCLKKEHNVGENIKEPVRVLLKPDKNNYRRRPEAAQEL